MIKIPVWNSYDDAATFSYQQQEYGMDNKIQSDTSDDRNMISLRISRVLNSAIPILVTEHLRDVESHCRETKSW